jgi:hypothetical protein
LPTTFAPSEEALGHVIDAGDDLHDLCTVAQQVEDSASAEEPVHVVEVPAASGRWSKRVAGAEPECQFVDVDELLQQGAGGVSTCTSNGARSSNSPRSVPASLRTSPRSDPMNTGS